MNVCHMASHFSLRLGLELWPSKQLKKPSSHPMLICITHNETCDLLFLSILTFLIITLIPLMVNVLEADVSLETMLKENITK